MFMQVVRTSVSCDFATQDGGKLSHAHFWAFYVTMATPIAIPLNMHSMAALFDKCGERDHSCTWSEL